MQDFFTPKSIAVIGASKEENKVGHIIFKNLYKTFKTFAVNLNTKEILGEKAYPSVKKIKEKIDLAIIAIPAEFVLQAVQQCGEHDIKHIIIVSSGFKEIGNERLEYELSKLLTKYNIKSIGPNCLGVFDAHSALDSLFLPQEKLTRPKAGGISFISQSGAVGSAVLDLLAGENVGFAKFISYGNGTNISETELLEYLGKDKQTKVICMYIEGVKEGKKFMDIAKKINKPIIVIKGGKTEQGAKAAMSHTGSLAGSYDIYKGAFKQSKIIIADSLDEMFHIAKLFEKLQTPKGKRIQVITNGGGYGILTIDALGLNNLQLAQMSSTSHAFLKHHVPKLVIISNPMDLVGDVTNERYGLALNICAKDKNIDILLVVVLHQTPLINKQITEVFRKVQGGKPIIVISTGGTTTKEISATLENINIPVFEFPEEAVHAIKKWLDYYN
ncbi:CoA-binding protein [Candidatus Woesearchaeota archaeon]|nr:CoA-binding protein [Candidatus Woesearchaeota archaeon]